MINYSYLSDAIHYYTSIGYKYVETPWIVPDFINNITKPKTAKPFSTFAGELVASGEQSFLHEIYKGNLNSNQKYVTCTPCFRDEQELTELTRQYFMKVELIWFRFKPSYENYLYKAITEVINEALNFFKRYLNVILIKTLIGWDIITNDEHKIELGSYGIRETILRNYYGEPHGTIEWVYGTGVAEPRMSYAIKKQL